MAQDSRRMARKTVLASVSPRCQVLQTSQAALLADTSDTSVLYKKYWCRAGAVRAFLRPQNGFARFFDTRPKSRNKPRRRLIYAPKLRFYQHIFISIPQSVLLRRTMLQQRMNANAAASTSSSRPLQSHCYTGRQRRLTVSARLVPPKVVVSGTSNWLIPAAGVDRRQQQQKQQHRLIRINSSNCSLVLPRQISDTAPQFKTIGRNRSWCSC